MSLGTKCGNRELYRGAMCFRPVKYAIASSPHRPLIAMAQQIVFYLNFPFSAANLMAISVSGSF